MSLKPLTESSPPKENCWEPKSASGVHCPLAVSCHTRGKGPSVRARVRLAVAVQRRNCACWANDTARSSSAPKRFNPLSQAGLKVKFAPPHCQAVVIPTRAEVNTREPTSLGVERSRMRLNDRVSLRDRDASSDA